MTELQVIYEDDWLTRTLMDLHNKNVEAMALRRRGHTGVASQRYAKVHEDINDLLDELETLT